MRALLLAGIAFSFLTSSYAQGVLTQDQWSAGAPDPTEVDDHRFVLTPEEESEFWKSIGQEPGFISIQFRFAQTDWYECTDEVTGNYRGYSCVRRRQVANILKNFMDENMTKCVNHALVENNFDELSELHLIHMGVLGDPRHSPRSLHAENRAIDIHTMRVQFAQGGQRDFVFGNSQNRRFFESFRTCWGHALVEYNDCPYYDNNPMWTGSIGWEDRNHQSHMHTSVPYCIGGSYAGTYFRR
jgi:hypothetical protein